MNSNIIDITTEAGANELVNLLKVEGYPIEAMEIINVCGSSFTGTELVMGIKFTLNKIDLNNLSDISKKRIENLLKYLNENK
jgi:hypothetical protein